MPGDDNSSLPTQDDGGRTAIVTGATSGLGRECARELAHKGWTVVLAVRDTARGRAVAQGFGQGTRSVAMRLDLASLDSVREFVREVKAADLPPLKALVCNAGLQIVSADERSADGFELTFAINHLGHFALVEGLLDQLAPGARVIVVGSGTHDPANRTGMPTPAYESAELLAHPAGEPTEPLGRLGRRRYTTSKLCNVLFAYELDRRLRADGSDVTVNVFDPGLMPDSGLSRDYSGAQRFAYRLVGPLLRIHPQIHSTRASGARLAALAADDEFAGVSGKYLVGAKAARSSADSYDLDKARDLWQTSERLVDGEPLTPRD